MATVISNPCTLSIAGSTIVSILAIQSVLSVRSLPGTKHHHEASIMRGSMQTGLATLKVSYQQKSRVPNNSRMTAKALQHQHRRTSLSYGMVLAELHGDRNASNRFLLHTNMPLQQPPLPAPQRLQPARQHNESAHSPQCPPQTFPLRLQHWLQQYATATVLKGWWWRLPTPAAASSACSASSTCQTVS